MPAMETKVPDATEAGEIGFQSKRSSISEDKRPSGMHSVIYLSFDEMTDLWSIRGIEDADRRSPLRRGGWTSDR